MPRKTEKKGSEINVEVTLGRLLNLLVRDGQSTGSDPPRQDGPWDVARRQLESHAGRHLSCEDCSVAQAIILLLVHRGDSEGSGPKFLALMKRADEARGALSRLLAASVALEPAAQRAERFAEKVGKASATAYTPLCERRVEVQRLAVRTLSILPELQAELKDMIQSADLRARASAKTKPRSGLLDQVTASLVEGGHADATIAELVDDGGGPGGDPEDAINRVRARRRKLGKENFSREISPGARRQRRP